MLKRFFAYYQPYKGLFMLDFGCAVLAGLLELGFPIAVKVFVDDLLPGGEWGFIIAATVGLLAIYLLNTGLMAVVTYWGHMLGINIETEMRRRAFDHLQKLSFGYFDNVKTGHLVGRLTKDLEEIGEIAHHGPEDLFIAVMTFIGAYAQQFIFALTFNSKTEFMPLPVGLFAFFGKQEVIWNELMAASFVGILPVMIVIVFLQRYLVAGLTAGAVKQ